MDYTSGLHIKSVKDIEAFFEPQALSKRPKVDYFHHIVFERKVNFHLDDMFEDYVSCGSGINTFTMDKCSIYNRLMDESFDAYNNKRIDIYAININKLMPEFNI